MGTTVRQLHTLLIFILQSNCSVRHLPVGTFLSFFSSSDVSTGPGVKPVENPPWNGDEGFPSPAGGEVQAEKEWGGDAILHDLMHWERESDEEWSLLRGESEWSGRSTVKARERQSVLLLLVHHIIVVSQLSEYFSASKTGKTGTDNGFSCFVRAWMS